MIIKAQQTINAIKSLAVFLRNVFGMARHWGAWALVLAGLLSISACGFQLRGIADIGYKTIYIQGAGLSISAALNKALKVNGIEVVDKPEKAELLMESLGDGTEKRILSLSGGTGAVREFELFYRMRFRLKQQGDALWGPVQLIENRRDFSYIDSELLAKQYEEQFYYQDMRQDAVREVLRRLVVQKPSAQP